MGYFQGPGSSIEFSAEERNGYVYLVKNGEVHNGELLAGVFAESGAAYVQWTQQAEKLRRELADIQAEQHG
jgi:hypothetical protein